MSYGGMMAGLNQLFIFLLFKSQSLNLTKGDMEKLYGKWDYFTAHINDGIAGY